MNTKLTCCLCLFLLRSTLGQMGPLTVSTENPRYFAAPSGKIVYLTGSHVWNNVVDMGPSDPPPHFDFPAYLTFLKEHHHNFIRLWTWELCRWNTAANSPRHRPKPMVHIVAPLPYARNGPGTAADGKPRFDLNRIEPAYLKRLKERVAAAERAGIYVSVMCFEGWGLQRIAGSWRFHPFNPRNNIHGIDGDLNGDGKGLEVHELLDRKITAIQQRYVKALIDTVNEFDNVLYEISNENHPGSTAWQYHMIRFIHAVEKKKPKQHPVGMTFQFRGGSNKTLFRSPAEWISPNPEGGFRTDPPDVQGRKVVLNDTDHLWGIGGNAVWVWKSCCRGLNPIFMDPYDGRVLGTPFDPRWDPVRKNLGCTRRYCQRLNLGRAVPHADLTSTRYCLAEPGRQYLVFNPNPKERSFTVTLAKGTYQMEWFDPQRFRTVKKGKTSFQDGTTRFTSPFEGTSVLFLRRE